MKNWKKSVCLILVTLFLVGCGGTGETTEKPSKQPTEITNGGDTETSQKDTQVMSVTAGEDKGNGKESESESQTEQSEQTEQSTQSEQSIQSEQSTQSKIDSQEPPKTFTIRMVGDVLLHDRVEEAAVQEDGSRDFSALFTHTKHLIESADLAIVNQEVILGGEELGIDGYPCFNGPFEVADALVEAGFDVVCHGTNHALDKGRDGILNCLNYWDTTYPTVEVLGIHDSEEDAEELCVIETEIGKLAILNYTYGTNGIKLPKDMPYAVDYLQEDKVKEEIARAKESADFVIVCPHWGTEYRLEKDEMQKKWSQIFSEAGADLVLGTHPHVIEPMEWVGDTLIYYSLGNYVNWTSGKGEGVTNRMVGGMAEIILERNENDEITIANADAIPLVTHLEEGTNGVTVYEFDKYTEDLANQNAIQKQDAAFSYQTVEDLISTVWFVE